MTLHNLFFARAKRESDGKTFYMSFNVTGNGLTTEVPLHLTDIDEDGQYHVEFYQISNGGLTGAYFADAMMPNHKTMMQRIDSAVNFTWSQSAATSVRWNGFLRPHDDTRCCLFVVEGDNVRLWVNNVLLIDRWHQSITVPPASAFTDLSTTDQGQIYEITLEVRQLELLPSIKLMWNINGRTDVIGQEYLYFKVRGSIHTL
jgi:hypothetical protein